MLVVSNGLKLAGGREKDLPRGLKGDDQCDHPTRVGRVVTPRPLRTMLGGPRSESTVTPGRRADGDSWHPAKSGRNEGIPCNLSLGGFRRVDAAQASGIAWPEERPGSCTSAGGI